jgi:gamma-glutamyltranspeptidase / glutathione hydrolase
VYDGEIGQAIDATVRENDGFLSIDDLRENRARWRETISLEHRGYEVVAASPPSTSWGALVRLGMLGQFGLEPSDHNTTSYLHTFAEVSKQTGRVTRDYAADPEIAETPLDLLLSKGFLAEQAAAIDPNQASPNAPFGQFGQPTPCIPQSYTSTYAPSSPSTPNVQNAQSHTTHFVVADGEGNVVSATQSLGNIFGSKVMPEGTGIWLNDALAWSRFEPTGNVFDVYPGRQSLYALCPTLVMSDGRPYIAIGTPGGRTIQQTTPQMLTNLIDFDMNIQQAIAEPRISTTNPNVLLVEPGIPESVRGGLASLGHNVRVDERGLGNAHGLTIEYDAQGRTTRFTGGADPRGVGAAAGY